MNRDRAGWRGWLALAVLMLPVLLVAVDNTVLSFALPSIALQLEPTSAQQLWIIDSYPLMLAALLVTAGTLGDRFGRRRMLLIGSTGFGVVSVFAAFSPSAEALIAGRALLGVFGALLMPSTLSLLRSIFTNRDERRLAIAVWASGFSAGAALGPIVGGFLLEHFAWGSVFLMSVPVLLPLLILAPFLVPESKDPNPGKLDVVSVLLSLATMVPIVAGIKEIAVHGLTGLAFALFAVGLVFGWLFVRRQHRLTSPLLDMSLFKHGTFSGAIIVNLLSIAALIGFLYFVAQHLQLVVGLSPMQAGFALVPGLAAMIAGGLLVVPIAKRGAPRVIVPAALGLAAVAYLAVAFATSDMALLLTAFAVLGAGIGAAETVSNELVLNTAPPAKAGAASAVSETAYELGAVVGTAVLGGILTAMYRTQLVVPPGVPEAAADAARETLAGAVTVSEALPAQVGEALRVAAGTAFDAGVSVTSVIGAGLMIVGAIVAALTLGGRSVEEPSAASASAPAPVHPAKVD